MEDNSFVHNALADERIQRVIAEIVQKELKDANQKLAELNRKMEEEKQNNIIALGRHSFKQEILEDKVKILQGEIERLKSDNAEMEHSLAEKNKLLKAADKKKFVLNATLGDTSATLLVQEREIKRLKLELKTLKEEAKDKVVHDENDLRIEALEKVLTDAKSQLDEKGKENAKLKSEIVDLKAKNERSEEKVISLEAEMETQRNHKLNATEKTGEMSHDSVLDGEKPQESENANRRQVSSPDVPTSNETEVTVSVSTRVSRRKTSFQMSEYANCTFSREREERDAKWEKFVCSHCTKSFQCLSSLSSHTKKVHKKSYSRWLRNRERLEVTVSKYDNAAAVDNKQIEHGYRSDSDGKSVYCKCGNKYGTKSDLYKHVGKMTTGKLFLCPQCSDRFYTVSNLKAHLKRKHKIFDYDKVGCNKCGTVFQTMRELYIHQVTKH